jgi:serine protease AprX
MKSINPLRTPGWRWRGPLTAAAVAVLASAATAAPAHATTPQATHVVQLRPGVSPAEGARLVRDAGGRVTERLTIINALGAQLPANAAAALSHERQVKAVSANAAVISQATSIDASQLVTAYPASAKAPQAWNAATGKGVGVAVVDTGIAGDLPDFKGTDGRSRVIASAVVNPAATTANDTYGHGTHVAGILAGDGTQRDTADPLRGRYIGVAPEANLISVKVADDAGRATELDAIRGLQFVVDHRAAYNVRVVNLSLSSTTAESYRKSALDAAVESAYFHGIVVVAAVGNRGAAADAVNYAPGNDPFAISVAGVDDQGTMSGADDVYAAWSSRGTTQDGFRKPDIGAPGAQIVSTLAPGSAFAGLCPTCVVSGKYFRAGGTSMAAPIVAGAAALVIQKHPDWTPDEVKSTLIATGRKLPNLDAPEVNAVSAVAASTATSGANAGVAPNPLVNATTGDIDYSMSSWSMSSWSTASGGLSAGFAMSSWSCAACASATGGSVSPSMSSWSMSSWSTSWAY